MLLLFDIDGTLLQRASHEHAEALHAAVRSVHGVNCDLARVEGSVAGRTDGEIARILLLAKGVSAEQIDARAEQVIDETCRFYAEMCPEDLSDRLVPGVADLLTALSGRHDVQLALVTGNFEPVARLKLKHAGIGHHFATGQGGFGSDAEDRAQLPGIARRRAGHDGRSYARERTVVIGDTPRDVACARADGVHVIGVTTGPYPAGALTGADAVVDGPAELERALAELGV
jgi:phosphoglycolate phosphatase-like HAD superfamily hydrolase